MVEEIDAYEMRQKSAQRQSQLYIEKKQKIMEAILNAATKYGKTSCEIDSALIAEPSIITWLTNTLHYTLNGNIVDWSKAQQL